MSPNYLSGPTDIIVNSHKIAWFDVMTHINGAPEAPEIRVTTWNDAPFMFANPMTNYSYWQEFIKISGPLYGLIKESAKRINYR